VTRKTTGLSLVRSSTVKKNEITNVSLEQYLEAITTSRIHIFLDHNINLSFQELIPTRTTKKDPLGLSYFHSWNVKKVSKTVNLRAHVLAK
jgi:hypothetical protein